MDSSIYLRLLIVLQWIVPDPWANPANIKTLSFCFIPSRFTVNLQKGLPLLKCLHRGVSPSPHEQEPTMGKPSRLRGNPFESLEDDAGNCDEGRQPWHAGASHA